MVSPLRGLSFSRRASQLLRGVGWTVLEDTMLPAMPSRTRAAASVPFLFALFAVTQVISFLAVAMAIMLLGDYRATVPVSASAVPPNFPVVVVTPDESNGKPSATVVLHAELTQFLEENPDHTFLIPADEADALRGQVEAATRSGGEEDAHFWFATFKAYALDSGTQRIQVDATGDDDYRNTGWYEASQSSILPRRHCYYFGGGLGIAATVIGVPVSLALNVLGWLGVALWRSRGGD